MARAVQGALLEAAKKKAGAAKLLSFSGLFAVYKPPGFTSAAVLNRLRAKLLAVVGIGKGTKMLSSMLEGSKQYTALGELGKATNTFSSTGKVTEEKPYELSSCATIQELTRTKQGPFTLEEHVLYEDKWTIDEIAQSLERCMPLLQEEPSRKKLKTELPEEHTMNSEDK